MSVLSAGISPATCYVVIVNYNGWKDTVECLESLLKSDYEAFKVIVCDNSPSNTSLESMKKWANGEFVTSCSSNIKIRSLVYPLLRKPILFDEFNINESIHLSNSDNRLIFVKLKDNKGFAEGMNWGIRLALKDPKCQYIWCLNNDTVVGSSVMKGMISILSEHMDCGICSSYTRSYQNPDKYDDGKQRIYFNKWLGNNVHYTENKKDKPVLFNYDGASFMIRRDFVENVGLMEERYFLYYEEPDWTIRGAKRGYKVIFYPEGIVYHKGGQSTGGQKESASYLADYYLIRGRILITKKFYPYCLPTVYAGFIGSILHRIQRKQYNRIGMILKLMVNPKPLLPQHKQGGKCE